MPNNIKILFKELKFPEVFTQKNKERYLANLKNMGCLLEEHTEINDVFPSSAELKKIRQGKQEKKVIKILDLESNDGNAAAALINHYTSDGTVVEYYGVDIDAQRIGFAREIYANRENMHFHCCDASDINKLKEFLQEKSIDLMVFRHPVVNFHFPTFLYYTTTAEVRAYRKIIFEIVPYFLKENGMIFSSFYHKKEELDVFKALIKDIAKDGIQIKEKMEEHTGYVHQEDNLKLACDQYVMTITQFKPKSATEIQNAQKYCSWKFYGKMAAEIGFFAAVGSVAYWGGSQLGLMMINGGNGPSTQTDNDPQNSSDFSFQ